MSTLETIPTHVAEIIRQNRTDQYPTPVFEALYAKFFSPNIIQIDTVSISIPNALLQPEALSEYYRTMPRANEVTIPQQQFDIAAAVRSAYRTEVLPHMRGTHLITSSVVESLPDHLREETIRHWIDMNQGSVPAFVRMIAPKHDSPAVLPDQDLMLFHDGRHNLPAVYGSALAVRRDESETIMERSEHTDAGIWEHDSLLSAQANACHRELAWLALSVPGTDDALRRMI
jgi:hypothetical protein